MSLNFNKKARLVIYNLAFLFLFLLLAELFLRWKGIGYDNAGFEPDRILHHRHKKNYSFLHSNAAEKEYSSIPVFYDALGCVSGALGNNSKAAPKKKIALMGDSFIEGIQVSYRSSLTGILQSDLNDAEVRNFGVGGYSPLIYLLQLKEIYQQFQPDLIVLSLYSNDVREDKEYLQKADLNTDKQITGIDGGASNFRYVLIRNSYLLRYIRNIYMQLVYYFSSRVNENAYTVNKTLEESPVLSSPTTAYLDSIYSFCKKNNVQLILTAIPSKYKIINSLPNTKDDFASQCKSYSSRNGIKFIDLTPAFEAYFKNTGRSPFYDKDIHFNVAGHAITSEMIRRSISVLYVHPH